MLFNTLANLRVLIGLDAPRAQAMLDHLNAYLRATLGASRAPWHPLSAEFDRLADYLALMAVRMGPRLQVVLDLPDELRRLPLPPLLLQPLVENAIKHGLEPKVAGGRIEVGARRDGDMLELSVRDSGVGIDGEVLRRCIDHHAIGVARTLRRRPTLPHPPRDASPGAVEHADAPIREQHHPRLARTVQRRHAVVRSQAKRIVMSLQP